MGFKADLSAPDLGAAVTTSGLQDDLRALRTGLAQCFATLVDRVESATSGRDLGRARVLGEAFVRLSEPILGKPAPARASNPFARAALYGPQLEPSLRHHVLARLGPDHPDQAFVREALAETAARLSTMTLQQLTHALPAAQSEKDHFSSRELRAPLLDYLRDAASSGKPVRALVADLAADLAEPITAAIARRPGVETWRTSTVAVGVTLGVEDTVMSLLAAYVPSHV